MGVRAVVRKAWSLLAGGAAAVLLGPAAGAVAQSLYVANQDTALVSVINATTGRLATTIATGAGPFGIAVSPDGGTVAISNADGNSVTIVDAPTANIRATVPVGIGPAGIAITPDGKTAYVANSDDGTVSAIALGSASVAATIRVGLSPFGVAVLPNGSAVYVSNSFDNTVSVIATASNTVTATIPVGASPSGIAASPDGSSVYVSNSSDNTISLISPQSNTVAGTRAVGALPFGLVAAPNGALYVANLEDGTISAFPPVSSAAATINVGGAPYSLATDSVGTNLFVANKTAKTVSVIAASGGTVSASFAVPGTPGSFGAFFGAGGPPASLLAAAILPDDRSVAVGNPATLAATVLNTGGSALNNCKFGLPTSAPAGLNFLYQTTSAGGQLTGTANQPVSIAGNSGQNFLLAFQSAVPAGPVLQPLQIICDGTPPAADVVGLDLAGLLFSATPGMDVIALAATFGNDGIVSGAVNGGSAFAVATSNIGIAGTLTALVDTQGIQLPLSATLCRSNPNTGACMAAPSGSAAVTFAAGETGTFSVFVNFAGAIPFAPASSRVFLRFLDTNGVSHGSTSVAARTL